MSTDVTKRPTTSDLLMALIGEIRGLRDDMRRRSGLPDVKIGKAKMRDWTGPSYEGKAASECPADFLLEYAGFLEWKAGKNRDEGKDQYVAQNEREALMCRRWAAVNRGLVAAPEKPGFRRATHDSDDAPTTQDSRRDPAQQPATEARPKWGGVGWSKKASG